MLFCQTSKIICVGLPKTGTSSISMALFKLGYQIIGWNKRHADLILQNSFCESFAGLNEFDGCRDIPWAVVYKELDRSFPGSKFILTLRNLDSWMKSNLNHFDPNPLNPRVSDALVGAEFRRHYFGASFPCESPENYINFFHRHNEEVIRYFRDRLLIMNLENGDGWDKLCSYLECDVPDAPFPKVNRADEWTKYKN